MDNSLLIAFEYINKTIECGDFVEYIDTKSLKDKKGRPVPTKIKIIGLWDGEKVECCDNEKTLVKNIN
jgi:hypothetical protein